MAFRKSFGKYGRRSNFRKVMRPSGHFTKNFQNKIKRTVQRQQPTQRKVIERTPPMFTEDRPWRRTVRYIVPAAGTGVTVSQVLIAEALYYGATASRWNTLKLLGFKAYGQVGNTLMYLNIPALSNENGPSSFTDYGDGCNRAVVSVDMPATSGSWGASSSQNLLTFNAGTVQVIDFYVELA